jgi:hypothetical protein
MGEMEWNEEIHARDGQTGRKGIWNARPNPSFSYCHLIAQESPWMLLNTISYILGMTKDFTPDSYDPLHSCPSQYHT